MEIPVEEAPPDGPVDQLTPRQRRQAIAAATLGNGLEFYDFITFAFFALQIGETFFPSESRYLSLMGSLATFGAGFITRPLGAHILGGYADRVGRKPAMLISISMMGAGIILLVITPGYATIGIAAPIIAVTARLLQGFALGGEVGSATIYMMESATPYNRGFTMSWQGSSQSIAAAFGSLIGAGLSMSLSDAELSSYGWRIALAMGVTIVPVALYIRRSLPETIHHADTAPVNTSRGFRGYARPVIAGFLIIGSGTIASYIFQYMATYGQHTLGLSTTLSMWGEFANNGTQATVIFIGGWLSDLHGRRPYMIVPQALFCLCILPCFFWLTSDPGALSFIATNVILAGVLSFGYGAFYAGVSESIPKEVRARVFALVYAIPVAVFGGTTQLVVTWILRVTDNPMSIAWYLTAVSFVGLAAACAMKESAPVKLQAAAKG